MLSPEEEQQRLAQQALQQLPTGPGPIVNATESVAAQSALPTQAMDGTSTDPSWTQYLGGMQQIQQSSPGVQGHLPVQGGTPTLARQQFEESVRQFEEEMAFRRAVEAARQAQAAAASRRAAASAQAKQDMPEPNVRAAVWDHVRGVVDDAVKSGQDWSYVNQYLVSQAGQWPSEYKFADLQKDAFQYYDHSHPDGPAYMSPPAEYVDDRGWWKTQWHNITGQDYEKQLVPGTGEGLDRLAAGQSYGIPGYKGFEKEEW